MNVTTSTRDEIEHIASDVRQHDLAREQDAVLATDTMGALPLEFGLNGLDSIQAVDAALAQKQNSQG